MKGMRYGAPAVGSVAWAAKKIQALMDAEARRSDDGTPPRRPAPEMPPRPNRPPTDPNYPPGGWQHVPGIQPNFVLPPGTHPGLPPNNPSCPNCGMIFKTPEIRPFPDQMPPGGYRPRHEDVSTFTHQGYAPEFTFGGNMPPLWWYRNWPDSRRK